MGTLDGKVAIVTGAGRGLGRSHALLLAREGASVVVNDLGGEGDGTGADNRPATEVAAEITAFGGQAVGNYDSVSSWTGAQNMINQAVETYGRLDILMCNAGFVRDRRVYNMTEEEWDSVIDVHLKGHFVPTRWAATYWREQTKAGVERPRNIVHTSSTSGLLANPGQANYGAAKSGIASFNQICAKELVRYGVKSNCIAPAARTRLTEATPGLGELIQAPDEGGFDVWDPANISPLVVALAAADCPFSGETFFVQGGKVAVFRPWTMADEIDKGDRWEPAELLAALSKLTPSAD
jgi:NAD(P)-dependent dehydrogenase (short-subunit alcohol dehydrogenase family)